MDRSVNKDARNGAWHVSCTERSRSAVSDAPERRRSCSPAPRRGCWIDRRRLPARALPDHLTILALLAAGAHRRRVRACPGTGPAGCSPCAACSIVHWLGDSLDGTLARVRRIERPDVRLLRRPPRRRDRHRRDRDRPRPLSVPEPRDRDAPGRRLPRALDQHLPRDPCVRRVQPRLRPARPDGGAARPDGAHSAAGARRGPAARRARDRRDRADAGRPRAARGEETCGCSRRGSRVEPSRLSTSRAYRARRAAPRGSSRSRQR